MAQLRQHPVRSAARSGEGVEVRGAFTDATLAFAVHQDCDTTRRRCQFLLKSDKAFYRIAVNNRTRHSVTAPRCFFVMDVKSTYVSGSVAPFRFVRHELGARSPLPLNNQHDRLPPLSARASSALVLKSRLGPVSSTSSPLCRRTHSLADTFRSRCPNDQYLQCEKVLELALLGKKGLDR